MIQVSTFTTDHHHVVQIVSDTLLIFKNGNEKKKPLEIDMKDMKYMINCYDRLET